MTNRLGAFWARLPLRFKGALIVGVPVAALLASALTSVWVDGQNDDHDLQLAQAHSSASLIDEVGDGIDATVTGVQQYTLTEDPDALRQIDSGTLQAVDRLGRQRDPRTGEPYAAVGQSSATLRELLLRTETLTRSAASRPASDREEDSLDYLAERLLAQRELLDVPAAEANEAIAEIEGELRVLEEREGTADSVTLLIGLFGGIAAAVFFGRSFTARISELGAAAERLAAGDFAHPFPRGSDEIGRLAERVYGAFNDLRASERRSSLILESSGDAYVATDAALVVTAWNRSAESILGWTKAQALGRSLPDLVFPEDLRQPFARDAAAFLAGGESRYLNRRVESRALHRDGHVVPTELTALPIAHDDDVTFHLFVRDLTDAKAAEEEVASRTLRMAEIMQTMNQMAAADLDVRLLHSLLLERAVSVTKADGAALQLESGGLLKIVAGVGPVAECVGRTLEIGRSMTGLTFETRTTQVSGDLTRDARVDHTLADDAKARSAITVPLVHDDHVVGVLAVHAERRDAFGEAAVTDIEILGGFFGAVISKIQAYVAREVVVRERTEALEELRALHAEMAAKNQALVAATEDANAASHAKSEFLSRMSHELRTPLNAILGFAQLLQADALDDDQADSVAHILSAGRHLLELINEVLEIARIESGGTGVTLTSVPVSPLVRESVDLIRPLAADRSITLGVADLPTDALAWADERKVRQVLLNLLSNAVKYNREGGRVDVCVECSANAVHVTVADTGRGIPADRLASLFTPFDRLGAERTSTEGTGLGLAVSQKLTEAMGGTLVLSTTHASGSVFRLTLETSEPGLPLSPQGSPPASRGTPARAPSFRVLYVEDDESNARLVQRALRRNRNVDLEVVTLGSDGLARIAEAPPAVVLLDMDLPDATGIDVLHRLRADEATASLPVVVLSADATSHQMRAALDAGADGYLTKPVDLDELVGTVERLAAREHQAVAS